MQKNLFFVLSLTSILCCTGSSPVNLGSLEYDNLDTDLSKLKYEPNDGDLEDFFKTSNKKSSSEQNNSEKEKNKTSVSGFKKKNTDEEGLKVKYDLEGLKKFLKQIGLHDAGSYDDGAIYGIAKGLAAKGVGVTGNEERKYKKGIKSKGFHKISHKDEYNKDNEFYVEDETSGVIKKIGAKGIGFELGGGAGIKKGYFHHDHDKGLFGKEGVSDKAALSKEYEGYSDSQGFDGYFESNK